MEHCATVHYSPIGSVPFHRYNGVVLGVEGGQPFVAHYWVGIKEHTGRLECSAQRVFEGRLGGIFLIREPEGRWLGRSLNERKHSPIPTLDTAVELDFEFTPVTNMLAINRLNLAVGESAELVTAWVRFPTLTVEPFPQRYTRLAERTYRFESEGFAADLEVDDLNLVVRYGDLWERVAVSDGE